MLSSIKTACRDLLRFKFQPSISRYSFYGVQLVHTMSNVNHAVPNAKEYYPLNNPSIGATLSPVRATLVGRIARASDHVGLSGDVPPECKAAPSVPTPHHPRCHIQQPHLRRKRHQASHGRSLVQRTEVVRYSSHPCASTARITGMLLIGILFISG